MSKHRALARPRWARIGVTGSAVAVVIVAVLAAFGVFSPASGSKQQDLATDAGGHRSAPTPTPSVTPAAAATSSTGAATSNSASPVVTSSAATDETAVPVKSGSGRRAVFDQSEQRVWIVGTSGKVARTYPVSGSDEDNLRPGTYSVYSKSRWAVGIDDSGTMQYFVRFAHGTDSGASIGFHSIPTKDGKPLQTVAQLGQRLSHGCIRQKTPDAIAMWDFAQLGTKVVVVA